MTSILGSLGYLITKSGWYGSGVVRDDVALSINNSLELDKIKSRILPELLTIWLNWQNLWKEKKSTIRTEAGLRFSETKRPDSSKVDT